MVGPLERELLHLCSHRYEDGSILVDFELGIFPERKGSLEKGVGPTCTGRDKNLSEDVAGKRVVVDFVATRASNMNCRAIPPLDTGGRNAVECNADGLHCEFGQSRGVSGKLGNSAEVGKNWWLNILAVGISSASAQSILLHSKEV
jgi:hypothetical protein